MDVSTIVNVAVPLLAAILGGLATAFFSRPKSSKKPVVTFSTVESKAHIADIGLPTGEEKIPNRIAVKSFEIRNISSETITDLIVEYKNLKLPPGKFHTENDPSKGLLESYYEVAHSPQRESLRYAFNTLPPNASFTGSVTFNDFWVIGGFQANSSQALVIDAQAHATGRLNELKRSRKRLQIIYVATVSVFLLMTVFLLLRQ